MTTIFKTTNKFIEQLKKNSYQSKKDTNEKKSYFGNHHRRYKDFDSEGCECIECKRIFTIEERLSKNQKFQCLHCGQEQKVTEKNVIRI